MNWNRSSASPASALQFDAEPADDLLDRIPCGIVVTRLDGSIVSANRMVLEWTGLERNDLAAGRTFQELLTVPGRLSYEAHLRPLLLMQGSVHEIASEIVRNGADPLPVLLSCNLRVDGSGHPMAIRVAVFRAIERTRHENEPPAATAHNPAGTLSHRVEERDQLLQEVNHRAKNLLSIVQAIAFSTAKTADPANFAYQLSERIGGLAANQDLLVRNDWGSVDVADLVRAHLAAVTGALAERIRLDGPPLRLMPAAAQALGMALHELAANARTYGALSNEEGRVRVGWSRIDDARFALTWREEEGPPVDPPKRSGFGHTVIVTMAGNATQGEAALDYDRAGLRWRLVAPLKGNAEPG